jgi:hypothetical protein
MGGRGVPPEVVNELQEGYAQIGLGDEPSPEGPQLLAGPYVKLLDERLEKGLFRRAELGALHRQRRRKYEERWYHAGEGDLPPPPGIPE